MRLELALRHDIPERVEAFREGLRGVEGDIFVCWNRFGINGTKADECEERGGTVWVVENSLWGNGFLGKSWLSVSRRFHNLRQPHGGPERWDGLGVSLPAFRTSGETVILPQRGIGHPSVKMPMGWALGAQRRHGGRIRNHPGKREAIPLERDLERCGRVVTWGSGAAVKALIMGIPVTSELPNWVAESDPTEESRMAMFRRLAWSQWTLEEISRGLPFHR